MSYTAGGCDAKHATKIDELEAENEVLKQMIREYYKPEIERLNRESRWLRMLLEWHGIEVK